MTYISQVLRDNPVGLWSLDGNLLDESGFNNDGTVVSGSLSPDRPLVAGGISSNYFSALQISYPNATMMSSAYPVRPFTLEGWVKLHNLIGTANVFVRNTSGVFVSAGVLYFRTTFGSTNVDITYPWLQVGEIYHVVAVFSGTDIYMYVNGEVVGSQSIDDSLLVQGFGDSNTVLTNSVASGSLMTVDSSAIYNYALSQSQISTHYSLGTAYPKVYDISRANGGNVYVLNSDNASVKVETEDLDGSYTNVALIDGELVNVIDPVINDYAAGVWEKSISLTDDTVNLTGSSISWIADSAIVVSVAIDDGIYSTVTNGSQPFSTLDMSTDHTVRVKAEFPAGAQSTLKAFNFTSYYSKTIRGSDESVVMTVTNPDNVTLDTIGYDPVEFADNSGALIASTGAITIPADANFGGYEAVELTIFQPAAINNGTLVTLGGATPPAIKTNSTGQWLPSNLTALIVDGVVISAATTIPTGRWHHVIAIFAANTNAITINSGIRVGYLAVYPANTTNLTTAGAQAIYNAWVGAPANQYIDANTITVSEGNVKAYTYDWAIQPAG